MVKSFLSLNNISYSLPNGQLLFADVSFDISQGEKCALIGENGAGKSTLLQIIAQQLKPLSGSFINRGSIHVVPQNLNLLEGKVGDVLALNCVLEAIERVSCGNGSEDDFDIIGNKWDLSSKLAEEFAYWKIEHIKLDDEFSKLSGGEKEKVLLCGAFLSDADILLFDEPTNNLDTVSKELLLNEVAKTSKTVLLISHDRMFLNEMNVILELTANGISKFGGNYDFYVVEKQRLRQAVEAEINVLANENSKLMKAKAELQEKKSRQDKYGEKQKANHRYGRLDANAKQSVSDANYADKNKKSREEFDTNKQKIYALELQIKEETIKIPLPEKPFYKDKLVELNNVNFGYDERKTIIADLSLIMSGKDRLLISGGNGSGKTTLIKLILGTLKADEGEIKLNGNAVYLDQNLSLLDRNKTLLDNVIDLNQGISINKAYAILANFKFRNELALKKVSCLSGGELLRGCLAAILGTQLQPELLILDEPTNNLDIKSIEILEEALRQYQGAVLLVSHDKEFVKNAEITKKLNL